jgi:hypothetical protein
MKVALKTISLNCVLGVGSGVAWGATVQHLEIEAEGHTWTYQLHVQHQAIPSDWPKKGTKWPPIQPLSALTHIALIPRRLLSSVTAL